MTFFNGSTVPFQVALALMKRYDVLPHQFAVYPISNEGGSGRWTTITITESMAVYVTTWDNAGGVIREERGDMPHITVTQLKGQEPQDVQDTLIYPRG